MEMTHVFKYTGPDILYDNVTLDLYTKIITNKRIKGKLLARFLMDQKRVSGVGNWMKAEILYLCRLSPWRTLESLTSTEIAWLHYYTMWILQQSIMHGGLTIGDWYDLDGKKGGYVRQMYKAEVCACGGPVTAEKVTGDDRTTHWCPNCQR